MAEITCSYGTMPLKDPSYKSSKCPSQGYYLGYDEHGHNFDWPHVLDYLVWPGGKVMLKMINFSKSVKCLFQIKSACQTCIRSSFTEYSHTDKWSMADNLQM